MTVMKLDVSVRIAERLHLLLLDPCSEPESIRVGAIGETTFHSRQTASNYVLME